MNSTLTPNIGRASESSDPTNTIDFSNGVVAGGGSNDAFYYYETLSVPAEVTLSWPCTFLSARLYIIQEFPSVGVFGTVIERLLNVNKDLQFGDEFYCGTESWIIPADTVFMVSFNANYGSNHPDDGEPHPSSGGGSFEIVVDPIILE